MIKLDRQDAVWILTMCDGENRFNRDSLDALHGALDTVQASAGPAALVTTGEGKFYSDGNDLDWLVRAPAELAGKDRRTLAEHRRLLYGDVISRCGADVPADTGE